MVEVDIFVVVVGISCFACGLLHVSFLLGLLFDPEDGRNLFLRNVGLLLPDYTAVYPRKWNFSEVFHLTYTFTSSGRMQRRAVGDVGLKRNVFCTTYCIFGIGMT
jgi:hypothetical protein